MLTYEAVQEIDLEYTRPVIILGALKDRVNDDLMREWVNEWIIIEINHSQKKKIPEKIAE